MPDSHEFLLDSLFCEYAYLINLDTLKLEVYRGFNQDPKAAGRYAAKQEKAEPGCRPPEYFGVVLVIEFPLSKVRKTTSNEMVKKMEAAIDAYDEDR